MTFNKRPGKNNFFGNFSTSDKLIFILCLLIGAISTILLTPFGDQSLFSKISGNSSQPIVGKIVYQKNDTRVKSNQELVWLKAQDNQNVRTGDTVFSGEKSLTKIELKQSNQIILGENSLVHFATIENEKVADLKEGQFNLKIDGDVKIAFNGKLKKIKGKNSEIEVSINKDSEPQIKLITGRASLADVVAENVTPAEPLQLEVEQPILIQPEPPVATINEIIHESTQVKLSPLKTQPIPPKESPLKNFEEVERQIASIDVEATNSAKLADIEKIFLNDSYKNSKFSVNGFLLNVKSSQQIASAEKSASVTGVGFQANYWWDQQGLEAHFKSGEEGSSAESSLKILEARYNYRFNKYLSSEFIRELQISLFTGYEIYRVSGANVFSSKYDIIKLGAALDLPLSSNWSTGGEVAVGRGTDSSNKYEFSTRLNYYLQLNWSLGIGYNLHLFEAGSTSSSANGTLPYREGYTEEFLNLNYHF